MGRGSAKLTGLVQSAAGVARASTRSALKGPSESSQKKFAVDRIDLPRTETAHDHDDPEMALLLSGVHLVQVPRSPCLSCRVHTST